jgi:hypothetical protein
VRDSTSNRLAHSSLVYSAFVASVAMGPTACVVAATCTGAGWLGTSVPKMKSNETEAVGTILVTLAARSSFSIAGRRPKSSTATATGACEATDTTLSLIMVTMTLASISFSMPWSDRVKGSGITMRRFWGRSAKAAGSTLAVTVAVGYSNVSKNRKRMRTLRRSTPVSTELRSKETKAVPSGSMRPEMLRIVLVSTIVFFFTD